MSLVDYFTGQQSWADYISNRDLGRRFEKSLTKTGDRLAIQLSRDERNTAWAEGLGALESSLTSNNAELLYEVQDISAGIDRLNADFHILMGDVVWKLEMQTVTLKNILSTLKAPLDTASKELRARAEDAYLNRWYEEALTDFLQSEQKNYQDFSVHRSIGNIYLYHLVDLPKAVEYFEKAAKYARPRDSRQAAEAEFFTGIASGLQQDHNSALKHMLKAISLNGQFYEAYYSCASFASLLGQVNVALDNVEQAVQGDARYYDRCRRDPCFNMIRSHLDSLLARLLTREEGIANSRIIELQQTIQLLRQMGVGEGVLQNRAAQLREVEGIRSQGHYSALRVAAERAFTILGAFLLDGITALSEGAKALTGEIALRRSEFSREVERIEHQLTGATGKRNELANPFGMTILLIFGVCCLCWSWSAAARGLGSPGTDFGFFVLSIPGFVIGARGAWAAGASLVKRENLSSQIGRLGFQAAQARDRLQPGRDEQLRQLGARLVEVQQNWNQLSRMLAEMQSRRDSGPPALPSPMPLKARWEGMVEVGNVYLGRVVRIVDFGAFVELFPGTQGLLHISELSEKRVNNVRDELSEGDQIPVRVLAVEGNKIKLSRKAASQVSGP